jgi:hypothetical protein
MGIAFGPSWSVRLTGKGHHAPHFHPGGIVSSACYICLPDGLADSVERPGWLELGRPPAELGLDLPPRATVAEMSEAIAGAEASLDEPAGGEPEG